MQHYSTEDHLLKALGLTPFALLPTSIYIDSAFVTVLILRTQWLTHYGVQKHLSFLYLKTWGTIINYQPIQQLQALENSDFSDFVIGQV